MTDYRMSYGVMTTIRSNGVVAQELQRQIESHVDVIAKWVLETRNAQTRDALIAMGWVPPEGAEMRGA